MITNNEELQKLSDDIIDTVEIESEFQKSLVQYVVLLAYHMGRRDEAFEALQSKRLPCFK